MTNAHVKRWILGCMFLLTAAAFFPRLLPAQDQGVSYETGFYYTVQQGDTLWDISSKFFDTPLQWPDLWQKNSRLPNPHWIYPGDRLHLYRKDGKLFVEKIVPAATETAPPVAPEPPHFRYAAIDQVGFIRNPADLGLGAIFKVQGDREMISFGDTVYIESDTTDAMPVGSRLTVYRTFDPVKDPGNGKDIIGAQHYLTGVVEVTRQENGYVMATVVQNFRTINIADRVMPYAARSPKIFLADPPPALRGQVISSEEPMSIIGDNTIAFINRGQADGICVGQRFKAYQQETHKLKSSDKAVVELPPVDIGTLLVLHTEPHTATVLVTYTDACIEAGTSFRSEP